jgi:hypothetical protein
MDVNSSLLALKTPRTNAGQASAGQEMAPFMKMNHLFSPGRRFFLRFFRAADRPSAGFIP